VDTTRIYRACNLLRDTLRLQIPKAKPVIGENAFATAAGIHQSGMLRDPRTYQFLDPNLFGRNHEMVIERHSGRHALRARFESMGIPLDDGELNGLYQMVLDSEQTSTFTDEDLLRLRRRLSEESPAPAASTAFQTQGGR
jgi:2-isopropylmalate synthase